MTEIAVPTTKAVVVPVEGAADAIEWPDNEHERLRTMYHEIGCTCVDLVRLPERNISMWIDDGGLLISEPRLNFRASVIAQRPVFGTVVLTPWSDGPDSPGFSDDFANELSGFLTEVGS